MDRLVATFGTLWQRKWWILAPTLVTALLTSVLSYYFLPTRYQSESILLILPARVSADYVRPAADAGYTTRVQQLRQEILSRSRLERFIRDFDLYEAERESAPLSDLVLRMRRDIDVEYFTSDRAQDDSPGAIRVSFVSSDPDTAMKITERLARLIIEENRHDREVRAKGTTQFIDSQIADVRRRLIAYENTLEELRVRNGRRLLSRADLLPYEVLQETYKALLIKGEESRMAANLERRQIGEQFRVIDPPRVPERPVGPSRLGVNLAGTLAGLALGLVLVVRLRDRAGETPG